MRCRHGLQLLLLSLDELLPVVSLDRSHDTRLTAAPAAGARPPPAWLLAYFSLHKIAGWVLGSFLVAGLARLTQRN